MARVPTESRQVDTPNDVNVALRGDWPDDGLRALRGEQFWSGADVVVEVVSGSAEDRARDYVLKRREYAEAAIPEYWIVDPEDELITVLVLDQAAYREHGVFRRGDTATSCCFDGLSVSVDQVLAAE